MSMRRRGRMRREGAKANIDMNSLIDLTFLLLVVFIVTLPTLEQSVHIVHIVLPTGKTSKAQDDKKKVFSISVDSQGKIFIGEKPSTIDDLKTELAAKVSGDPDLNVLIRGDVRVSYGDVYDVVKVAKDCNVKHLGLVSAEK